MGLMNKIKGFFGRNGKHSDSNDITDISEVKVVEEVVQNSDNTESQLETQTKQHKWYEMPSFKKFALTDEPQTRWYLTDETTKLWYPGETAEAIGQGIKSAATYVASNAPSFITAFAKGAKDYLTREHQTTRFNTPLFYATTDEPQLRIHLTDENTKLWYPGETAEAIGQGIKSAANYIFKGLGNFGRALAYKKEFIEYARLEQTLVEKMKEAGISSIDVQQLLRIPDGDYENEFAIGKAFEGDLDFGQKSSFYYANSELLTSAANLYDILNNGKYSKQIEKERQSAAAAYTSSIDALVTPSSELIGTNGTAQESQEAVKLDPAELQNVLQGQDKDQVKTQPEENADYKNLRELVKTEGARAYHESAGLLTESLMQFYTLPGNENLNPPSWITKSSNGEITGIDLDRYEANRERARKLIEQTVDKLYDADRKDIANRISQQFQLVYTWSLHRRAIEAEGSSSIDTYVNALKPLATVVALPQAANRILEAYDNYQTEKVA